MKIEDIKKPIIFCHYGNSPYLYYTLKQVKLTNPQNRIILLGDEKNEIVAKKAKVEHHCFQNYDESDEIKVFDQVYKHVAGVKHKKEFWTNFVFKRWFYVHNFIKKNNINAFWHFDSDNMILSDLNNQEHKFKDFDCTEQCNGICMNGYISSFQVVNGYVNKINALFKDEAYLNEQKKDFIKNADFAFTEMRAYKAYREQENINSIRLNKIIGNESFDDCICMEHGYETYDSVLNNQYLKKIYFDANGNFYCYHIESSTYIKMNSLNLSWVPTSLFKLVHKTYKKHYRTQKYGGNEGFILLDVFQRNSIKSRVFRFFPASVKRRVKLFLKMKKFKSLQ
ncbi:hypothetical protein [uncultured Algibacter sp.]|uniref:hypothetical protein n=1 Tax=uncultured Algibacter sp. TaxID=298659 RepID=UPI0026190508|nr:hypothetical protein [uncultured Algibacter sp.]